MSFCDHCAGQRFDRAQVLRALRVARKNLQHSQHTNDADLIIAEAIKIVSHLEIPHVEPLDEPIDEPIENPVIH